MKTNSFQKTINQTINYLFFNSNICISTIIRKLRMEYHSYLPEDCYNVKLELINSVAVISFYHSPFVVDL